MKVGTQFCEAEAVTEEEMQREEKATVPVIYCSFSCMPSLGELKFSYYIGSENLPYVFLLWNGINVGIE